MTITNTRLIPRDQFDAIPTSALLDIGNYTAPRVYSTSRSGDKREGYRRDTVEELAKARERGT